MKRTVLLSLSLMFLSLTAACGPAGETVALTDQEHVRALAIANAQQELGFEMQEKQSQFQVEMNQLQLKQNQMQLEMKKLAFEFRKAHRLDSGTNYRLDAFRGLLIKLKD